MKRLFIFVGALSNGGAERVVSNLSLHLPPEIERTILLFGQDDRIDYPYGGSLAYLDTIRRSTRINKLLSFTRRIRALKRLKAQYPEAVFISFLEYPNLINLLSGHRAKSIISIRNHMSTKNRHGLKGKIWNFFNRRYYPTADEIVAVSEDIRQDLIEAYSVDPEKIKVIYNFYDLTGIKQKSEEALEPEMAELFQRPVVITMGRLIPQKAQWHLLKAARAAIEQIPDLQILILGDGPLKQRLTELATELGIADRIHFMGFTDNPFKYIARSQAFVLTSIHEGFPNALAEAMACGVPVIATDCHSGPREILAPSEIGIQTMEYGIIPDRFGILIEPDERLEWSNEPSLTQAEETLKLALLELLKDNESRHYYSEQALKRAGEFSIEQIMNQWERLI